MSTERRQAEKTSFIFGREDPNTGSPITDRKQIVKRRYVVTSWNRSSLKPDYLVGKVIVYNHFEDKFVECQRLWEGRFTCSV